MATPFVGEVRMFGGNFAPYQWAFCNGQSIAISANETLFSLIGTTYGGNGTTNFNLPDLRGRLCVGMGQGNGLSNYNIGQAAGVESVTLTTNQIPAHSHTLSAAIATANAYTPGGNLTAKAPAGDMYTSIGTPAGSLNGQSCTMAGGNQPHSNLMPSLCVSFIIALYGIYPTRN